MLARISTQGLSACASAVCKSLSSFREWLQSVALCTTVTTAAPCCFATYWQPASKACLWEGLSDVTALPPYHAHTLWQCSTSPQKVWFWVVFNKLWCVSVPGFPCVGSLVCRLPCCLACQPGTPPVASLHYSSLTAISVTVFVGKTGRCGQHGFSIFEVSCLLCWALSAAVISKACCHECMMPLGNRHTHVTNQ